MSVLEARGRIIGALNNQGQMQEGITMHATQLSYFSQKDFL